MALTKRTGNEKPRPQIGKTADKTRLVRFVDLNKLIDEIEQELVDLDTSIQTDLTAIIQAVNDVSDAVADLTPLTAEFELSSADLLAIGASPVELLPAEGAGSYYEIDWNQTRVEYTSVLTDYTITAQSVLVLKVSGTSINLGVVGQEILDGSYDVGYFTPNPNPNVIDVGGGELITAVKGSYMTTNKAISIAGLTSLAVADSPTLGDGTLKVIITYRLRTLTV